MSFSTLSALNNAPAGSANETCAARAGRGLVSALVNVPSSAAPRPKDEDEEEEEEEAGSGDNDQRRTLRAGR